MRCLRRALSLASICLAVSCATKAWAQAPIAIGISAPVTGPYAIEGHQIVGGAQLAIDSINSQGGIRGRRLEGIFLDTANDPGRAVAEAQRVIEANKAVALVGYPLSGEALAVKRVAREKNVLMITLNTAPEVTADNTKAVLRVIGRADKLATMVADYVAENFPNSTVGVQSSGATVAFNSVLHQQLDVKKIRVNLSETVSPQGSRPPPWLGSVQTLVGPLGTRVPEWVPAAGRESPNVHIVLPQAVITSDPLKTIEGLRNLTIISNPWPNLFPAASSVIARARSEGKDPNGYFVYAYAAVQVLAASLARASGRQSAAELFSAAQSSDGIDTVLGRVRFSETGDLIAWHYAVLSASGGPPDVCQLPAAQCRKYESCPRDCPK